ncbi:MAG: multicopper oxidase domain-containing protein [Gemmatimonadota bacterium]
MLRQSLALVAVLSALAPLSVIKPAAAQDLQPPRTRTFYLAAEEVEWDYARSGRNQIAGRAFGETEAVFLEPGPRRIGRIYTKALYRAYTDSTFTTPAPVPPEWEHLGALGPVLRGAVGDTIRVVFHNRTRYPFSVHPHGVFYAKDSEGAGSADGTAGRDTLDDAVPPGGTHTYVWPIPERAGPGPGDPSSVAWLYHSHVSTPRDTNAGLIGAILVTGQDHARPDGSPVDVDREFVTLFKIYDENQSPYLEENVRTHTGDPESVDPDDEGFIESNLLHAINGTVYGNLPVMTMGVGERVRWYVLGLGNEADLHTVHWHGNTGIESGQRLDTLGLLPGESLEIDMRPDNPGKWLFHCHVDDHMMGGMQAFYRVLPAGG